MADDVAWKNFRCAALPHLRDIGGGNDADIDDILAALEMAGRHLVTRLKESLRDLPARERTAGGHKRPVLVPSQRLDAVVKELMELARGLAPGGRMRGRLQLSRYAVEELLDVGIGAKAVLIEVPPETRIDRACPSEAATFVDGSALHSHRVARAFAEMRDRRRPPMFAWVPVPVELTAGVRALLAAKTIRRSGHVSLIGLRDNLRDEQDRQSLRNAALFTASRLEQTLRGRKPVRANSARATVTGWSRGSPIAGAALSLLETVWPVERGEPRCFMAGTEHKSRRVDQRLALAEILLSIVDLALATTRSLPGDGEDRGRLNRRVAVELCELAERRNLVRLLDQFLRVRWRKFLIELLLYWLEDRLDRHLSDAPLDGEAARINETVYENILHPLIDWREELNAQLTALNDRPDTQPIGPAGCPRPTPTFPKTPSSVMVTRHPVFDRFDVPDIRTPFFAQLVAAACHSDADTIAAWNAFLTLCA